MLDLLCRSLLCRKPLPTVRGLRCMNGSAGAVVHAMELRFVGLRSGLDGLLLSQRPEEDERTMFSPNCAPPVPPRPEESSEAENIIGDVCRPQFVELLLPN